LKKLNQFTEDIQNGAKIWQVLNNFSKTSQVVEIKDVPILGDLIREIFIQ
jgi:hypothetical protein